MGTGQRVACGGSRPSETSALQALQSATISVARALWTGSWVIVNGETECSDAEVADSLVCFAACGYSGGLSPAVSTPSCCLLPKDPVCPVQTAGAADRDQLCS